LKSLVTNDAAVPDVCTCLAKAASYLGFGYPPTKGFIFSRGANFSCLPALRNFVKAGNFRLGADNSCQFGPLQSHFRTRTFTAL